MAGVDALILFGIMALLLGIGLSNWTSGASTKEFFLGGQRLRWWHIGFSLFATNFSASAIIGLTGAAYLTGIAIYNYEWVGILVMVFFAFVLSGQVRRGSFYSIAQFLEERFGTRIKIIYSALILFLLVFIDMAGALYAGGVLLREVFPGLSISVIILIIMLMAGTYSMVGGLGAISRIDMVQSVILICGAVLVSYYTLKTVGGWSALSTAAPEGFLSLVRPIDDRAVPWTGLVTGVPILCCYFWLVNQNMVQWVLSARSAQDARIGLMMAGYLKIIVLFIVVIPGVAAISLFPDLTEPDRIYPTLLFELLPAGILGLVLAGFVSAIMSSTDSILHASSTIITMDFVKNMRPDLAARDLVRVGRLTTAGVIVLGAVWAPVIGEFGTLFEYVQGLLSYAVAPFVVVYLAGWFWPRANETGALLALACGFSSTILFAVATSLGWFEIHYLHVPLPVSLLSLLGLVAGSLIPRDGAAISWSAPRADFRQTPGSDTMIGVVLLVLVGAQLIWFW
ncbi:MAG: SLC5 family protein [Henriciella sp.]